MSPDSPHTMLDTYRLILDHARDLDMRGLGDISLMCRNSIVESMQASPNLPKVHAEEGRKFTMMTERIAPANLVASFMKDAGSEHKGIIEIPREKLSKLLEFLAAYTDPSQEALSDETRAKAAAFRYKPSEVASYIEHCTHDPSLQLSLNYYSIALQMFVRTVLDAMKSREKAPDMMYFGQQFDSKNLVGVIPITLHIALERRHGKGSPSSKIDLETVRDAMQFLHKTERFKIKATNRQTGQEICLECPIEGYLFDLFVKQNGLIPYMQSMMQFHDKIMTKSRGVLWMPNADQKAHLNNAYAVRQAAKEISGV